MSVRAEEEAIGRLLAKLARLDEGELVRFLDGLTGPVRRTLYELWRWQAHGAQREPDGDWRVWLIMAGRGFGKTRAGAEWVSARARETPGARIALVGATRDDAALVMVEGRSGLLAVARADERERVRWRPSRGVFTFASGAEAFVYSGEKPSRLRGPEHHYSWCDELAKWAYADATWDMLTLGLRLGERPRAAITTTPRTLPALKRIMAMERTHIGRGKSVENVHVSADWLDEVRKLYGGSRLGRQELDGEMIDEVENALWDRALLERSRCDGPPVALARVVIGVDPPAGTDGDACGIVACGLGEDGIAYVLADHTVAGLAPEAWAKKVAAVAAAWAPHRVVAEANNGGRMVEAVLRGADAGLPVKLVHASEGKAARAEPVMVLFESKRVKLAGHFPELEDELMGIGAAGLYAGPGRSPDRADAMVWALSELMLGPARREPSIRRL